MNSLGVIEILPTRHCSLSSDICHCTVGLLVGVDQAGTARQPARIDVRRSALCVGFSMSHAIDYLTLSKSGR